ncbi:MAG: TAXI family TRAP transporter solute-binding subunit [Burkholderiaceae bacterium]
MPRSIKLFLLSIRDLIASVGPSLVLVVGLLAAAWWFVDPQPPKILSLATGPDGSADAGFGQRYAMAFRAEGVEVRLVPTAGAADNLRLLRDGQVDAAFVRGGSADPVADDEAGLLSLGSLFFEPLWVFYRIDVARRVDRKTATLGSVVQLRGLRVAVDRPGSGVPEIVENLLQANRMTSSNLERVNLEPAAAAAALQAGEVDAIVLFSAPQSPLVQRLLRASDIRLMNFGQSEAYVRRFAFLSAVTLPRGVVEIADDLPPQDVTLLAATTSLLAREDTHPALRQLFARTAQRLHGEAGWFNRARDFPNTRTSELPVSSEGDRAINGTPPFWQAYLPFWASNLVERMWLVIGGVLVLLLPLSRIVPPLYTFRVRRRVFRWYARLREIEDRMDRGDGARNDLLDELDELDRVANGETVPLSHAEELYALRSNIEKTRRRLLARPPSDPDTAARVDAAPGGA